MRVLYIKLFSVFGQGAEPFTAKGNWLCLGMAKFWWGLELSCSSPTMDRLAEWSTVLLSASFMVLSSQQVKNATLCLPMTRYNHPASKFGFLTCRR